MPSSYQDLRVWQEAVRLVVEVYRSTTAFPKSEIYGLTSQMRRAAVSVPSNIAEGKGHHSDPEFCKFLYHARGSLLELQTQVLIARELQYLSREEAAALVEKSDGVGPGLNALITSLRSKSKSAGSGG